jgi:large subunit ribosomal protein L16
MGGGKGDVEGFVAVIKPGRIIFEVAGVEESVVRDAFSRAAAKLPFKSKVITKEEE